MISRLMTCLVFQLSSDAFNPVATLFCGEYSLNSDTEDNITEQAFLSQSGAAFPFIIRGPVQLQDFT